MANSRQIKDNKGRWQRYATIYVEKAIIEMADAIGENARKRIKNKLEEVYKANVEATFSPRSEAGKEAAEYNARKKAEERANAKAGAPGRLSRKKVPYKDSGLFLESIHSKIVGQDVKIVIKDKEYADPSGVKYDKLKRTTTDVYNILTKGSPGGGTYPYDKVTDPITGKSKILFAYNYPTPKHEFEMHTKIQMEDFIRNYKNQLKEDYKYAYGKNYKPGKTKKGGKR